MLLNAHYGPVNVAVLTTSYPRFDGDAAGHFVAAGVDALRRHGVSVTVVSPASFRHFGIAYGAGIVGNVRAAPWRSLALPAFLASFRRAAARAARDADVVHAHWLAAGAVAATLRRPFVVQVWGTDLELARRAPALARSVIRRARLVIAPSHALADAVRALGGDEVRVIPPGIELPPEAGVEEEPPHVLYAGRLSEEKGVRELLALGDLPIRFVGDGPLRGLVPCARFVPNDELQALYARAAVVACPSHREGFGYACLEAMAHGKPVVASAVGGLLDLVVDEETGLLVPPRDAAALRRALERLLADPDLRDRLGAAGRERVRARFSSDAVTEATIAAYEEALSPHARASTAS
jgi:glycosyltransferase involved in cell wall biosynthesis